ncbi:NUDIX hydrolase [Butyrivibrio sp. YAB3001]|uniref:NUDIX hydrolase n=1 Tax=Butyrivibrio sp. YAB3001 TaxID=1520812 RepID=UPI0008F63B9E|nr:NUDIX domain-containing protein [Butyrivibrio sp. YAB3001]SFB83859.1 8-oxo-dGTP diphosphatase [Butyrivibrio sp. YAB3001]
MLTDYKHPYVTVDLLLFSVINEKLSVCLTKRDQEPFEGSFSLPGTFIHENESAEGAVERLLSDKLELKSNIYTEQLQTFSEINRDPRERVISIAYIGVIPNEHMVKVPWMKWFSITPSNVGSFKLCPLTNETDGAMDEEESFISTNLGFDHDKMLKIAVDRLRSKLEYTDIIFKFLEDTKNFTSGLLRQKYQAVLGMEVNRGNFTKYQMNTYIEHGLIKKTGSVSIGRGRPADTYSYIGGDGLWIKY